MDLLGDVWSWFTDASNWQGVDGVPHRLAEHVLLSVAAVGIGCLLALPLAMWLGHIGRGGFVALTMSNLSRAVPVLAVLVLLALAPSPFGLSTFSTLTAFVLFAMPPLLTTTYVGIRGVDRDVVDAARGMGMGPWQLLWRVEVPLAKPLIITGLRLAAVQVVATVTLAAFVAGGGLGRIIASGYGRQDDAELVAGALLVAGLALSTELALLAWQRRATLAPAPRAD